MVPFHYLQPEGAGEWGEIDAPAAKELFKLAPFLADRFYQPILALNLPQLRGYTPVSSA